MNAPEPVQEPLVQYIEYSNLVESPTNPRQVLEHLNDLADSIARVGVLQPLLVRPKSFVGESGSYEIVSGHRRFAAAKLAAEHLGQPLPALPCRVVKLTDEQACEVQIVENLQRSDLHPMEEALGYERLRTEFGQTADEIAARIGKSRGYVFAKLKLLTLVDEGREAFRCGQMSESVALLVARIPQKLQPRAVKVLTQDDYRRDAKTESISVRLAQQIVSQQFTTDLRKAQWKLDDAELLADVPACVACPKMAANSPDEYPDIKDGRTCMDPTCFSAKKAAWERQLEEIALTKADVKLKAGAAREAIDSYSGKIRPDSGLVKLTDKPEGSSKTWNQLAKDAGIEVETIAVIDKSRSKVHVVAKGDQLAKALNAAGVKVKAPKASRGSSSSAGPAEKYSKQAQELTAANRRWIQLVMSPETLQRTTMEQWAAALLEEAFDRYWARNVLSSMFPDQFDANLLDDEAAEQRLREILLPDDGTDKVLQTLRAAMLIRMNRNIEVQAWALLNRGAEIEGAGSVPWLAKRIGVPFDAAQSSADPTPVQEPGADGAAAAKPKRSRKSKAAPAAEVAATEEPALGADQ